MAITLIYLLKVNLALALFYAFYRLFLSRDTFFRTKRILLISFLILPFIYPFLNLNGWFSTHTPAIILADIYPTVLLPETIIRETTAMASAGISWTKLMGIAYGLITGFFVIRLLWQFFSILTLRMRSIRKEENGCSIWQSPVQTGPFSFFHWIFLHPAVYSEKELREILTHEQAHCRQWHSIDILLSEIVCICCWFNPFAWLLRKEIAINLEYLADAQVLSEGHDRKDYQYHLLHMTTEQTHYSLMNRFRMLPLKSRIQMMNKKRSHPALQTKYVIWVPLLIMLILASNVETMARTTSQFSQEINQYLQGLSQVNETEEVATDPSPALTASLPTGREEHSTPVIVTPAPVTRPAQIQPEAATSDAEEEVVFDVVEQMPEFPGGQAELMKYLATHIHYPPQAQEAGIQGRVIAQLTISDDGTPTRISIVRGIHPDLDNETIRILSGMPKWSPGRQRGKAVNVRYTIPVSFKLTNE